ncbi:MAG: DNA-processing protein DprA [Clostridia bacterium]|nr:DNA-processing protein DprA [Clostridia bacterium]
MAEKDLLYRLWLNDCCSHNPSQVNCLLREFGTPEEIFKLDLTKPAYSKFLRLGQRLRIAKNLDAVARNLEAWQKEGIQVLSIDEPAYPERLREIYDPPQILYVKGELPDFNRMLGVTVVGARKATDDGRRFARAMAKDLAAGGGVIVSGLAVGADSAALWGALEAGGITVAVLAGGVDKIYPKENTELYYHILKHGCILSEQPPGTIGKPYFYEQRNRIMVGLSHGVVVVEGEVKSGTAITVRLAQDANADVFAVPGNPLNAFSALPNELIRDGCTPMTGALDIIEEYLGRYPEKLEYGIEQLGKPLVGVKPEEKPKEKPVDWNLSKHEPKKSEITDERFEEWILEKNLSFEEKKILQVLREQGDEVAFDDIADACGIETGLLSSQLIILQMKKAVSQSAGGRYSLQI